MVTIQCTDFDIGKIRDSGQCFRMKWQFDNSTQVTAFGKTTRMEQEGDRVHFYCSESDFEAIWRNYFDLNTNYTRIIEAAQQQYADDQYLMDAITYSRGIRILNQEFFETLISFIMSQRNNIPRIKRSIELMSGNYRDGVRFPTPSDILCRDINRLRECGAGYRDKYIMEACKWYSDFPGDWQKELKAMGYEDAMKTLMTVKGIGKKVANCICLFGLHYMNACPVDVWIQRIIDNHYMGATPAWFSDPYAGLLQQFVFFYERRALVTAELIDHDDDMIEEVFQTGGTLPNDFLF